MSHSASLLDQLIEEANTDKHYELSVARALMKIDDFTDSMGTRLFFRPMQVLVYLELQTGQL